LERTPPDVGPTDAAESNRPSGIPGFLKCTPQRSGKCRIGTPYLLFGTQSFNSKAGAGAVAGGWEVRNWECWSCNQMPYKLLGNDGALEDLMKCLWGWDGWGIK
jgi:hypothetical protein